MLLLPPCSFGSFCFVRLPASLGPSLPVVCFCISFLASLGQLLVFRVPASLGSSPLSCAFVHYCTGFSGKAFCGSRLILVRIFPTNNSTAFSFSSLGNPLSPTFPDKNSNESQIFSARVFLCPFFLLGIRDFSKFLVGKVRTCLYLPPPKILDKFPNRIPDRISSDLGKSQIGTWPEK